MNKRIFLNLPQMSGEEQKYIQEAFETHWVAPQGPNVDEFEIDLESFLFNNKLECAQECMKKYSSVLARLNYLDQWKKVVALNSGTAALHLSLVALGIRPGDEVICQSFTFCASCHPISYLGATPVLVDSEIKSWNMDPELLEIAIKDRITKTGAKPKAIMLVYLFGMPAMMDEIMTIAGQYDIPVIEDAAEGFGSCFDNRYCGTFGQYGILSFNGNKMITTGGGGALICPNEEIKKKVLFYATQAREPFPYYQHEQIGYNYRMSNINAGIGRGQMSVAHEHIKHHRYVAYLYKKLLADVKGITLHENPSFRYNSNYWLNAITLDSNLRVIGEDKVFQRIHTDCEPNCNVEAMRLGLEQAGIESRPLWKPMHKQPIYQNVPFYVNGVSESLFKTGLCLPSGPCVTTENIIYIVNTIQSLIEN